MKTKGKHAKANAPSMDESDFVINKLVGVERIIFILASRFGMREGEIYHMRDYWIHIDDKKAKEEHTDHIEIPSSGEVCKCDKCMLSEYFEFKKKRLKDDVKTNHAWYEHIERRFYKLKKKGMLPKLREHSWTPKSDAGIRIIPAMFKEYNNFIKEYFEEHTRIENNKGEPVTRRKIHYIVSKAGKKFLNKKIYPHSLRAGLATFLGNNGMNAISMCAFFGWETIASAKPYVHPERESLIAETKRITDKYSTNFVKEDLKVRPSLPPINNKNI